MIWDRIKEKINETFKQDNTQDNTQDKPKVFQTTDKLDKIKKNVEKNKTVLVYNPLSQRTFFKNPETDSYIDGKVDIGDDKTYLFFHCYTSDNLFLIQTSFSLFLLKVFYLY